MGCCNGRKNRIKPTGTGARKPQRDATAESLSSTKAGDRKKQTFAVQSKTGKKLTFGSKLEAKAEVARNGGILKF